jgi:O-antigen ligase
VLLPLLGVAVGLTGNRTAWVGLGAVAALTWLRYASPRLRVGLALAGLALGIAAWEGRPDVRPAATGFVEGDVVKALAGRPRIWAAALEILQEHPLIGVGAGAFPTAWDQWREGALAAGRRAGKAHLPADNLVVGLVVELGLPGAVLGGWLVLVLFRAAPRSAVRALGLPWLGLAGLTTELLPERGVWLLVVAMLVAPPDGQDQGRRVARTM